MSIDMQAMVREFHEATGATVNDHPTFPADKVTELRISLITEEANELVEALRFGTITEIAKEIAYLLYVVLGTAVALGINASKVFKEVHRSNMSKLVDGKPVLRHDGKVLKGPNYAAPDVAAVMWERQDA